MFSPMLVQNPAMSHCAPSARHFTLHSHFHPPTPDSCRFGVAIRTPGGALARSGRRFGATSGALWGRFRRCFGGAFPGPSRSAPSQLPPPPPLPFLPFKTPLQKQSFCAPPPPTPPFAQHPHVLFQRSCVAGQPAAPYDPLVRVVASFLIAVQLLLTAPALANHHDDEQGGLPVDDKAGGARIKAERADGRLDIRVRTPGQKQWIDLASFVMKENARPYLHPVRDASGKVVLTEDKPADHPWQHGIFTGFHRVNGFNYWKEDQGRQRFVRLMDLKESSDRVSWRALVELVAPSGDVVLEEEDAITIYAPEDAGTYIIDFDLLLRARDKDVTFGKYFVGGLAVRMPWDSKNPRQTHLNSEGKRNRECEQNRARWCNVERPFGSFAKELGKETFGIAIFDHPDNPNHPCGWRADEQGLINPNVSFGADWSIAAGKQQLFKYRLLVYRGSATPEQLEARYKVFAGEGLKSGQ
jgi:hypothetical protein